MKVTLRWGMKVRGVFFAKGTPVEPVAPDSEILRTTWHGDPPKFKAGSKSVAIRLPGADFATVVCRTEIETIEDA